MAKLLLFLILLAVCWPLALVALLVYPLIWVLSLPFRLLGFAFDLAAAVLGLLTALLLFPIRVLRPGSS